MKKFVVLLAVVALTCISSMAFAATEMAVTGQIDIRGRNLDNLDMNSDAVDTAGGAYTQERVRLNIDAKVGEAKGKISIENDWDTWGRNEAYQADASTGTFLRLREAWMNFNVPGVPVNVNAGHQLLSLGNGWFFRSMKYGSDAWVIANVTGPNTFAFVDVKFQEREKTLSDDEDAYVLLDVINLGGGNMAGINITDLKQRGTPTKIDLQNIGLHYSGKVGPVALMAELDLQMGKVTDDTTATDMKFKGNQLVIQGNVGLEPVVINFTVARGSGTDLTSTSTDITAMQTALDADQHYTFMYEYLIPTAAGAVHTGFANTTALNVGATLGATKSLTVAAQLWILQSTEDVQDKSTGAAANAVTTSLGNELDLTANWQIAESLSWNWTIGYFMPGAGMGNDTATGIQQVLSYKF